MTRGLSFINGKLDVTEEWVDKWSSLIKRARTSGERYERACDVIREIGLAAGDVMKDEPPERDIPLYAFQLGLINEKMLEADAVERVFNHAGHMALEMLVATLDPFNLPKDKAAVTRAFLEGVGDAEVIRA
ncbi:MAG: hypothetical protein LBL05_05400 [Synergistaceae bacterium]|jgi:hypothetical protein|nr:hypothetical protein [Synergistaceae bacterium]